MNITGELKQYFHLHFIIVLLGFTAILGSIITLNAIELVWFRTFFASLGLWLYVRYRGVKVVLPVREQIHLYLIGLVVALHWITFFHAIKVSNVSITLGVFASTTLFTSFLEPFLQKRPVLWIEVFIGMIILFGIYVIFQYELQYSQGIIYSLISAFLNGLFVVLNRNISRKWHPSVISFYEMAGGFAFISVFLLVTGQMAQPFVAFYLPDIFWILILSLVCTSYAFAAVVEIMKELSAYTVVLSINLEPVYGIILAFLFFGESEKMSSGFYFGTLIILGSVFAYPYLRRKFNKKRVSFPSDP